MKSDDFTFAHLVEQLHKTRIEAETLTSGVPEATGTWRAQPASWSIAECLEHLALFNHTYLAAMKNGLHGVKLGELVNERARPGWWGRMFVRSVEPPVKSYTRSRAAAIVAPRSDVSLAAAYVGFLASHADVETLLEASRNVSLDKVSFINPFFKGLRPTVATGFHIIAVHERRHLWQASVILEQATERFRAQGQTRSSDLAGLGTGR